MLFNHAFDGGIFRVGFFGFGSTAIRSTVITGKLALACLQAKDRRVKGWLRMGGRRNGFKVVITF